MKQYVFLWVLFLATFDVSAQKDPVLMKINNKEITCSEFEYYYNKNNASATSGVNNVEKYISLFINQRLKADEARRLGLDTVYAFRVDLANYRRRLADSCMVSQVIDETEIRQAYDAYAAANREVGEVQVMQICKYIPQNTPAMEERRKMKQMDSLYTVLQNNPQADFAAYVKNYSEDGRCIWFNRLQTSEEFEKVIFSLRKGEISAPFFTPQGVHIVKVMDKRVGSYADMRENIKNRLMRKGNSMPGSFLQRMKDEYQYMPLDANIKQMLSTGKANGTLFILRGKEFGGTDFIRFADGRTKGMQRLFDDFVLKSLLDCEYNHLEQKYPGVRYQVQDYKDMLLSSAMSKREIGEFASDKVGLKAYFEAHKKSYNWENPRFKGAVVHSRDKKLLRAAKKLLKKTPAENWNEVIQKGLNTGSVPLLEVEQGVFAEGDNPYVDKLVFKKERLLPQTSYPFTEVVGKKIKGPEDYTEVQRLLAIDYQNFLETQWMARLRSAGKVEIHEEVIKTVNNR